MSSRETTPTRRASQAVLFSAAVFVLVAAPLRQAAAEEGRAEVDAQATAGTDAVPDDEDKEQAESNVSVSASVSYEVGFTADDDALAQSATSGFSVGFHDIWKSRDRLNTTIGPSLTVGLSRNPDPLEASFDNTLTAKIPLTLAFAVGSNSALSFGPTYSHRRTLQNLSQRRNTSGGSLAFEWREQGRPTEAEPNPGVTEQGSRSIRASAGISATASFDCDGAAGTTLAPYGRFSFVPTNMNGRPRIDFRATVRHTFLPEPEEGENPEDAKDATTGSLQLSMSRSILDGGSLNFGVSASARLDRKQASELAFSAGYSF